MAAGRLARWLRAREWLAASPYWGIGLGLVVTAPLAWWLNGAAGGLGVVVGVLGTCGLPVAYLAGYLAELWGGRTVLDLRGRAELERGWLRLELHHRRAELPLLLVRRATWYEAYAPFDDLVGLHDVLELELEGGARLRLPETIEGVGDVALALGPKLRHVEV